MGKTLMIIIISIIIFGLCYVKSEQYKLSKAVICSGLIAVLGFAGPYMVEFGGNWSETSGNADSEADKIHEHKIAYEKKENLIEETCVGKGSYELVSYCECGVELAREVVITNSLEHNYVKTVTNPTCEEVGVTIYQCTRCKKSYVENEVKELGHDYKEGICQRCKLLSPDYETIIINKVSEHIQAGSYDEAISESLEALEMHDSEAMQQLYQDTLNAKKEADAVAVYTAKTTDFCVYNGAIEGEDETDVYTLAAPTSGNYRFDLSNMVNGFQVKLFVYDSAGNKMGGYSGVSNNHGITCLLEKGNTYSIKVMSYLETGNYTLSIGQPKEEIDVTKNRIVYDSIEYDDQINKYVFVPAITGTYRFDMSEMVNGFEVKLTIYDSLGYAIGGYGGLRNNNGVTVELVAGESYTVKVDEYSNLGLYMLTIGKQSAMQDITGESMFSGEITYKDQKNVYNYIPDESGNYNFKLNNAIKGFEVGLYIYDSLGYNVGGYGGVRNENVVSAKLNAGETYTIHLKHYSDFGSYEVTIYKDNKYKNKNMNPGEKFLHRDFIIKTC